jgi:hypothetical protein
LLDENADLRRFAREIDDLAALIIQTSSMLDVLQAPVSASLASIRSDYERVLGAQYRRQSKHNNNGKILCNSEPSLQPTSFKSLDEFQLYLEEQFSLRLLEEELIDTEATFSQTKGYQARKAVRSQWNALRQKLYSGKLKFFAQWQISHDAEDFRKTFFARFRLPNDRDGVGAGAATSKWAPAGKKTFAKGSRGSRSNTL